MANCCMGSVSVRAIPPAASPIAFAIVSAESPIFQTACFVPFHAFFMIGTPSHLATFSVIGLPFR